MKIRKRIFAACIATAITVISMAVHADIATVTAKPSPHAMYVDGVKVNVAAYEINNNNYFKLRDIAAVVNGTTKQFEVTWDGANKAIALTSGKAYTTVGGEMGAIGTATQSARPSTAKVTKDGAAVSYAGYEINNNNYYKLRDVAQSFNIGIGWDSAAQRVDIVTTQGYDANTNAKPEETQKPDEKPEGTGTTDKPEKPAGTATGVNEFKQPDILPGIGEITDEYQAILDASGEEIITKTINFKMCTDASKNPDPIPNAEMYVWADDACHDDSMPDYFDEPTLVTIIKSGSDGKGSFDLPMPKSLYERTIANDQYNTYWGLLGPIRDSSAGAGVNNVVNGKKYLASNEMIRNYYIQENPYTMTVTFHLKSAS